MGSTREMWTHLGYIALAGATTLALLDERLYGTALRAVPALAAAAAVFAVVLRVMFRKVTPAAWPPMLLLTVVAAVAWVAGVAGAVQ